MKDEAKGVARADGVYRHTSRWAHTPTTKYCAVYASEHDAEQKFRKTRRKHGEALTAYMTYAEVVSRAAMKYCGIYSREE